MISDIVIGDHVPQVLQDEPELWSGCISGALWEDRFLRAFGDAGFDLVNILKGEERTRQGVGGIGFRSMTVEAVKLAASPTLPDSSEYFMPNKKPLPLYPKQAAMIAARKRAVVDSTPRLLLRLRLPLPFRWKRREQCPVGGPCHRH